jgi:cysteine dioxygenase
MKMLSGTLSEVRFAWPTENTEQECLKEISRSNLKLNEVCYINDSLGLHRVENPSHVEPAVSLHLYSPPFSSCRMFDQRTGHQTKCNVTFWSKYGERTPYGADSSSVVPENN